jgi:photosystem II stability/assembly factor-like uncharacterized protein
MTMTGPRRISVALSVVVLAVAGSLYTSPSFSKGTTVAALAKETHFHGIAVDPADSSRFYLATHHGLYLVGSDGKAERISSTRDDLMGFTIHPTDPTTLFASGHPVAGGNLGFITSQDGGRSWTKLSDGVGGPVDFHQMDVSKADSQVTYGIYRVLQRSIDGGATWHEVSPAPDNVIAIAASSLDIDTLYAATQDGLLQSTDGGRNWKRHMNRAATMVHVAHDGTVFAFVIGVGLIQASERNLAWRVVGKWLGDQILLHLAADPRDPRRLYAVAHNAKTRAQSVITSRDGGERWEKYGAD